MPQIPNSLKLKSCPKNYTMGTHRAVPPEKTLNWIKPKIPTIGITRIANITGLDRVGIPVYSCVRPRAAEGAISVYSGKGIAEIHAEVSVIMEAVERYSAEVKSEDQKRIIKGSFKELSSKFNALDPADLIIPFTTSYSQDAPLRWIEGFDIIQDEKILVPVSAVFHPYLPSDDLHLFRTTTNGLASGNTVEEAVLHGLMEVIERDAWSLTELTKDEREVIRASEDCFLVKELIDKFDRNEIRIVLKDITSDLGLPVIAAVSDDFRLMDPALLTIGFGAHLDPEIAAIRALTEVAQSRLTQIQGAREDTYKADFMRMFGYERIKKINKHWFSDSKDFKEIRSMPNLSRRDILDEIMLVISILRKKGFEHVIVVDLTRKELEIPTLRVIVPGLEVYSLDMDRIGPRGRKLMEEKSWKK
ncbi:MAG: YcaO-related McrA-glycine thioamidation protein [Nitrososphaerales archaeon]